MVDEPQMVRWYPETNRAWATWVLLALNVLVYLAAVAFGIFLQMTLNESSVVSYQLALFLMGWKDNEMIYLHGQYWRLLTATFLHGGLIHLAMNGLGIYIIGRQTEYVYGTGRFVAVYFVSGLSGSVLSYAFNAAPAVGASGALFGIVGALSVFFYTTRNLLGEFSRSQLQGMIVLVVINLFFGFSVGNIDNFGHIGGLIGGVASGWLLVPRYRVDTRFLPPVVVKQSFPLMWVGVAGLFILLGVAVAFIQPPLPL